MLVWQNRLRTCRNANPYARTREERKNGTTQIGPCYAARYSPRLWSVRFPLYRLCSAKAPLSRNVAAATRDQILTTARQLGYHPDAYARSLRSRHSQTIAVLSFDLSDPFCIPVVRGIQARLDSESYLPLLMDAQTQRRLFDKYLNMILGASRRRRNRPSPVGCSKKPTCWRISRKIMSRSSLSAVTLSRRGISSVLVDNEAGGALAMGHLRDLGHRKNRRRARSKRTCSTVSHAGSAYSERRTKAGIRLDRKLVFRLPNLCRSNVRI